MKANLSKSAVADPAEPCSAAKCRVLLLVGRSGDLRLLRSELAGGYEVMGADSEEPFAGAFDLVLLDAPALQRHWDALLERKRSEEPVFMPVLLLARPEESSRMPPDAWERIDDVLETPVRKTALRARLQVLLRTRRLSVELKMRTDDLEAFMRAMTHELRAPARVVSEFARALAEDHAVLLNAGARHYVERITAACEEMEQLIDCLVELSRLGHGEVHLQMLPLAVVVNKCLESLGPEIESRGARVEIQGRLPRVRADANLLRIVLGNLLSNALKYVAPGTRPLITVRVERSRDSCRVQVKDNGIGIASGDQQRIFGPFIRLHGIEEYPGSGLGLAAARKAVALMGGRIGVNSRPGRGSTFWIDLNC